MIEMGLIEMGLADDDDDLGATQQKSKGSLSPGQRAVVQRQAERRAEGRGESSGLATGLVAFGIGAVGLFLVYKATK